MEKRKSKRYKAGTKVEGGIIFADDTSIINISGSGMRFETFHCINPKNIYQIELINKNKEKQKLTCETIWSLLKGTQQVNDVNVPIYEVGIKFIELNDIEKQFLDKFITDKDFD